MARSHAQQFASRTVAVAAHADPVAVTRAIATGEGQRALATLWDAAGGELAPIERMPATGLAAAFERRGRYTCVLVTPPAPRESGDPAAIAIIGRGDGVEKLGAIAYFVFELVLDRSGAPRLTIVSLGGDGERVGTYGEGPLPDPRWLVDHAFELYAGSEPAPHAGVAELPCWYWWYAFDGALAMRSFHDADDETERVEAVRRSPILLLPEIADAADLFANPASARRLREWRGQLRRSATAAPLWQALAERLASSTAGSHPANLTRALAVIAEAADHGALGRPLACQLEATVRSKLAAIGVEPEANYALAEQLFAAAREPAAPRSARGSEPPPIRADDPVWQPLFLDERDLPYYSRTRHEETPADPSFATHGLLRAGLHAWQGDERAAMAQIVDARWVFRNAAAAAYFLHTFVATLGDGLPALPAPLVGDETIAFGNDVAGTPRTQILVVRVGRVIARLHVTEGAYAAASRQILHAAMLHPLAQAIVQRARQALAAYWLAVASPTNAVPALVHSPGYDAARLLPQFPLLADGELAAALATLGESYAPAARALESFQVQMRAHRWTMYRSAMLALVRALLETDMGDPRVNAAHAQEIVGELASLDPDPIWHQLDAECRARG